MQEAERRRGVRAALFDLDGTLVHTHIDFDRMRREILVEVRRHGVPADDLDHLDVGDDDLFQEPREVADEPQGRARGDRSAAQVAVQAGHQRGGEDPLREVERRGVAGEDQPRLARIQRAVPAPLGRRLPRHALAVLRERGGRGAAGEAEGRSPGHHAGAVIGRP